MNLLLSAQMARDNKEITQFYLSPTHEPYLPLLPSHITALWLVLIAPIHWETARLSWRWLLVIYWDRCSRTGSWTTDLVTHPSTNRGRREQLRWSRPLSQTANGTRTLPNLHTLYPLPLWQGNCRWAPYLTFFRPLDHHRPTNARQYLQTVLISTFITKLRRFSNNTERRAVSLRHLSCL